MIAVTFEDLWIEYEPIVHSVAYEFGSKGNRWGADHEDFRQEFVAWMLDNESFLADKREEIEDPDQFGKFLARCLRNEGMDFLVDIKDQAGGQPRHGAYWYSTGELKFLLPCVFDREKWLNPPFANEGGRSTKAPAEGNNWVTTLADVARGFEQLGTEDQQMIRDFHQHGYRNKDMAAAEGVTEATMSYRHTQVLKRLLEKLGGPRPKHMRPEVPGDPWRGRHSISNRQARAITNSYYEED